MPGACIDVLPCGVHAYLCMQISIHVCFLFDFTPQNSQNAVNRAACMPALASRTLCSVRLMHQVTQQAMTATSWECLQFCTPLQHQPACPWPSAGQLCCSWWWPPPCPQGPACCSGCHTLWHTDPAPPGTDASETAPLPALSQKVL